MRIYGIFFYRCSIVPFPDPGGGLGTRLAVLRSQTPPLLIALSSAIKMGGVWNIGSARYNIYGSIAGKQSVEVVRLHTLIVLSTLYIAR